MPYSQNQYGEAFEIINMDIKQLFIENRNSLLIYPNNSKIKKYAKEIATMIEDKSANNLLFLSGEKQYKNSKLETLASINYKNGMKLLVNELEEFIAKKSVKNLFLPYADKQSIDEYINYAACSAIREYPISIFEYGNRRSKTQSNCNEEHPPLIIKQVIVE